MSKVRKPLRAGWVGPLFKWELVRLARRGQDARARFILASSLLVVLSLFTMIWFRNLSTYDIFFGTAQVLDIRDSARFTESFAITFMLTQLAVLVLLTPAYAAGGIAEEKERKTFPFLLVSDLRDHEIVFGKFLGRLVFLLGVMFAGLPILSLSFLYGGVSLKFLLMGYLLTATTVTLLASIAVASAAYAQTFRGALFRGYGISMLHIGTGCCVHPFFGPFGIMLMLSQVEAQSYSWFLFIGLSYTTGQLLASVVAVWIAMRGVRKLRSTLTKRPRSEDFDDDRPRRRKPKPKEKAKELPVETASAEVPFSLEGYASEPNDEPVRTATELPVAPPVRTAERSTRDSRKAPEPPRSRRRDRDDDDDFDRGSRSESRRFGRDKNRLPRSIENRPPVDWDDPFLWKETYVSGSKRDGDDESIEGVKVATGAIVALTVGFFVFIALMSMLFSNGRSSFIEAASVMLMIGGVVGYFAHVLMVGSAACGMICRERQRLTLESLLTIPVDRRWILWPKWKVCVLRGIWWGALAIGSITLAFLTSDTPFATFPVLAYLLLSAPLAASYGLWLSIRCQTMTRAVLWFLPLTGLLMLIPIVIRNLMEPGDDLLATVLFATAAGAVGLSALAFWLRCDALFEREGR